MALAAWFTASRPDEQFLFTVTPPTDVGKPASKTAIRATSRLSSPAWFPHPAYTSSINAGSIPVRVINPFNTSAKRSSGRITESAPPTLPMGDRRASTITTSFIGINLR